MTACHYDGAKIYLMLLSWIPCINKLVVHLLVIIFLYALNLEWRHNTISFWSQQLTAGNYQFSMYPHTVVKETIWYILYLFLFLINNFYNNLIINYINSGDWTTAIERIQYRAWRLGLMSEEMKNLSEIITPLIMSCIYCNISL